MRASSRWTRDDDAISGRGSPAPPLFVETNRGQAAVEAMFLVVDNNGPTMFARIGIMRALNHHLERVFNPDRKERHWGRRKLKRDE